MEFCISGNPSYQQEIIERKVDYNHWKKYCKWKIIFGVFKITWRKRKLKQKLKQDKQIKRFWLNVNESNQRGVFCFPWIIWVE